jgi:hypothetical protein
MALGENAHEAAFVGVFKAVEEHGIHDLPVAHAHAGSGFWQQVRCLAHIFHAAGDHDAVGAGFDLVVGHDDGLHAGAAHFVDGGAAAGVGDAGGAGGLACGCLAEATGQYAAHDDFLDVGGLQAASFDGGLDGDGAEIRGTHGAEIAHHAAHGSSC